MGRLPRKQPRLKQQEFSAALLEIERSLRTLAANLGLPAWLRFQLIRLANLAASVHARLGR